MKRFLLSAFLTLPVFFCGFALAEESKEEQVPEKAPEYYLGIQCVAVPTLLDMHLNLEGEGQLVQFVLPQSPAEKAAIKQGDILLAVGETKVNHVRDILEVIAKDKDREQTLTVIQKGKKVEIKIQPEKRPETMLQTVPPPTGMFRTIQPGIIFDGKNSDEARDVIRRFIEQMEGAGASPRGIPPEGIFSGDSNVETEKFGVSIVPGEEPGSRRIHVQHNNEVWDVEKIEDLPKELRGKVEKMIGPSWEGTHGEMSRRWSVFSEKAGENWKSFREHTAREMEELEKEMQKAYENAPDLKEKFEKYRNSTEKYFENFWKSDSEEQKTEKPAE